MAISGAYITGNLSGTTVAGTSATGALPASSNTLLEGAVSDILGMKSTAVTNTAAATAATTQSEGYAAEASAYGTAADTAEQNAIIAGIAGDVKTLQQQRDVGLTIGTQQAQVAAAGFGAAGSSLDLLRSSLQQGYLTTQLTATQTALTKGGYLEEAASSRAQKAAAEATGAAAKTTASTWTAAGALSTANAAKETAALNNFLGTATLTADQKLILDPLSADLTKPLTATTTTTAKSPYASTTGVLPVGSSFNATTGVTTFGNNI